MLCYNCFAERDDDGGACPHCGFDLADNADKYPSALRAGTELNGQYVIGRVLGQGGFGVTYLAFDRRLGVKVAVKEFLPEGVAMRVPGTTQISAYAGEFQESFNYGSEQFLEEAQVLAKFSRSPNIAAVKNYFNENDTAYFVMDYVEGISFKNYIANHGGKIGADDALRVMKQALNALTDVHREGLVHRDVTPDNIYITKDDTVKLLDFGSARYSLGDKSKSLDVILKAGYAPKEQYMRKGRQGPWTDVYSAAACIYSAITGVLPPEALARMENDMIEPPDELGADVPEDIAQAVMKGLEVNQDDRFQNAEEFLAALGEEVPAPANYPQTASDAAQPGAGFPQDSIDIETKQKKSKKKIIIISASGIAALLAVAAILAVTVFGTDITFKLAQNNYNKLAQDNKYYDAVEVMESYKREESDIKYDNDADYLIASAFLGEGDFEAAITSFSALGSFKDSPTQLSESQYQRAVLLYDRFDYEYALGEFTALGDYKQSQKYLINIGAALRSEYTRVKDMIASDQFHQAEASLDALEFYSVNFSDWSDTLEELYDALYPWEVTVYWSYEEYDYSSYLTSCDIDSYVYANLKVSGGGPRGAFQMKAEIYKPYSVWEELYWDDYLYDGSTTWARLSFYDYYSGGLYGDWYGDYGTTYIYFYNADTGEMIGSDSIYVY
ncbi:MAG: serine/threonine protein kinase [Oscillospiraceae bacterium]|jgi:serine/threonine protein kinase|nr:serine/threonine protein kinase [Oscillospiraceae bacterium]